MIKKESTPFNNEETGVDFFYIKTYLCDQFDIPEGKHHWAGVDAEMCAYLFLREIKDAGWCELTEMSYSNGKL